MMRKHVLRKPSIEIEDDAPVVRNRRGEWHLLGERVCLKAWQRIHALGHLKFKLFVLPCLKLWGCKFQWAASGAYFYELLSRPRRAMGL